MNLIQAPSKNFGGRNGYAIDTIVIHATDGFFPSDLEWLRGAPGSQVSSHYLIAPLGTIYQLVDDQNTAWHAGLVVKPSVTLKMASGSVVNPNLYSIGIEVSLKLPGNLKAVQWESLKELVKTICQKHKIPVDRTHILAHREIRSDKTCPGSIDVNQLVLDIIKGTAVPEGMVNKEAFKKQIITYINSL